MISALEAQRRYHEYLHATLGPGVHVFCRCTLCGKSFRVDSYADSASPRDAIEYVDIQPDNCERCAQVMATSPEIHTWIVGVFANLRLLIETTKTT